MSTSCTPWKATSNGAWSGDSPIHFALPLLSIQLCLILFFSRVLSIVLKPMHQPRVIAEILGGVLLGASAMGYIKNFTNDIFPAESLTVLTTVANIGLLFFLFMVGLELDLRSLTKTGTSAMIIALTGICAPFSLGVGASLIIRQALGVSSKFAPFMVFMGVAMSITAFPVLARILAERKLLTTDVGKVAMSAAAVNDVLAWVLLALAVALSASNASPSVVAWILLCALAFLVVMFVVVRPLMGLLCKRVEFNAPVPEWIVAITLTMVMVCGFVTDSIGIHGIFGAFVFGLIIPKDGPFASLIIDKIEDFTMLILLPLYFASSGLNVKLESISSPRSVGVLFLVIGVACVGKIGGTLLAALASGMEFRKSLALGILMNTKGLVELIVLNIGLQKQVINQEIYTIMVIMALVTTFMTTPLLMWLYEPARERVPYLQTTVEAGKAADPELRLLVCINGSRTIPGMLNLIEILRGSRKKPLAGFLLHLVEYSERSSAVVMVTHFRRDGRPFVSKAAEREGRDQVAVAFQNYARLSRVQISAMTAISELRSMHEEVARTAQDKRASLVVLPYHKQLALDGSLRLDVGLPGFQAVNRQVLRSAPCSVAVLVDRGFGSVGQRAPGEVALTVAMLFFGGPDDREALAVAARLAEHPGILLKVIVYEPLDAADLAVALAEREKLPARSWSLASLLEDLGGGAAGPASMDVGRAPSMSSFVITTDQLLIDSEARLDTAALAQARQKLAGAGAGAEEGKAVVFEERVVEDAGEAVLAASREGFDLLVVGRGRRPSPLVALLAHAHMHQRRFHRPREEAERLGPVGEELVGQEVEAADGEEAEGGAAVQLPSLLVVQQHDEFLVKAGEKAAEVVPVA